MLDFRILIFLSLLTKVGGFPLLDWLIEFLRRLYYVESWLFFSLKKFIPFYIMDQYVKKTFFIIFLFFFFNLIFRFKGVFKSKNFFELISWSSVGGLSFFILNLTYWNFIFVWEIILIIYSFLLYYLFYTIFKKNENKFFFILFLFGLPPFSMFLFKIRILLRFLSLFSIFWNYIFIFIFWGFRLRYFIIFLKESKNYIFFTFSLKKIILVTFIFFFIFINYI